MIRKDLRDKRAALLAQNRALTDLASTENRELTADEMNTFEQRMSSIDALSRQITLEERQATQEAARERPGQQGGNGGGTDAEGNRGGEECNNLGEFIYRVRFQPHLLSRATDITTDDAAYLIPTQIRTELLQLKPEDAIVRPRATVIPAGDPPDSAITMPALDQSGNYYGGVEVAWIAEGGEKPQTDFGGLEFTLTPHEVAGLMVVTDKTLRNWAAAEAFIKKLLRGAITSAEDQAFLSGNGVGKPRGVRMSPGRVTVVRNTAATVKFVDLAKMLGKMLPESMGRAVWVANQSLLTELVQLKDDLGATIFIRGDATKSIPDMLFGRPLYFTGKTPVAGSEGDLMLIDFTYYAIKDGAGPFVATSPHVHFKQNKTVIKAFWNVDGDSWLRSPIKLEDGSTTVSPFVILQ